MRGSLWSLLFPVRCPYCGIIIERNELECEKCRSGFPNKPYIRILPSGNECVAAFQYNGVVREALKRYKFCGKRDYYKSFSAVLVEVLINDGRSFDLVTSVPLSKKRMRVRGYNQSELIAREVARLTNTKYIETIEKICENKEQHNLNHEQRKTNIIGVYHRIDGINFSKRKVLLIDDIVTTGYTLSECCQILEKDDNVEIFCAVIANSMSVL